MSLFSDLLLSTSNISPNQDEDWQHHEATVLKAVVTLARASRAHQRGQIHPHREDIIRVGVHIHSQSKLHIWRLNIVNAGAVDRLYDGSDLREGLMQRESRDLQKSEALAERFSS